MGYFRITRRIYKYIELAQLEKLIGCSKFCDKQIISYEHLELLVDVIKNEMKKKGEKGIENANIDENIEENTKPLDTNTENANNNKTKSSASVTIRWLLENQPPLNIKEHLCNINLQESKFTYKDIIQRHTDIDYSKVKLDHISEGELKKQEKMFHKRMGEIQQRREQREYDRMVANLGPKKDSKYQIGKELRQMKSGMDYAANFILSFFLSFALGYFMGKYAMGYDTNMVYIYIYIYIVSCHGDHCVCDCTIGGNFFVYNKDYKSREVQTKSRTRI